MKFVVPLAAAALFALSGCGGESENMPVQYPPTPPGVDAEPAGLAASDPGAEASGPLAAASEEPTVEPQVEANGESTVAYAQPQAGDIQIGADASEYADTDPSALQDFKPALDPYGTWREDATYGTVWTPSTTVVGADFAPYVTAGHWTYDDDYVWVSDYEWGWAPFHYGRWVWVAGYGWSWIPGRVYSGAWVTWRSGYYDAWYVGWAPMPPTWYWRGGYAVGVAYVPVAPYVFCGAGYVFNPGGVHGYVVTGPQVSVVASHTRPYVPANPSVNGGPGHLGAHPTVGGPAPRAIGLNGDQVPHSPQGNRGLLHAQQFARPTTAQSLGARPPVQLSYAQHTAPYHGVNPGNPGAAQASHFSSVPSSAAPRLQSPTTLGHGRDAPVATSPQYRGVSPTPYHAPSYSTGQAYTGHPSAPAYTVPRASTPAYSAPHASTPSYSPSYSVPHASAPVYSAPHPSPSYSVPHASVPSYSAPHASVPSYSAPHYSAPSVSGGSRPSGGGFRGGARAGRR